MNPDPNQQNQPQQPVDPVQPVAPVVPPAPIPAPTPAPAPIVEPTGGFSQSAFGAPSTPAPVPPVASPFAQPTVLGSAPAAPAAAVPVASSKKKLIILLSIIVGAVIVLGIAAVIVISLFTVSKADYQTATTQFDVVSTSYTKLNSSLSSLQYDTNSSTTDTQFKNDTDSAATSLKTFQDDTAKLSTLKAVKLGEGKKLYDTYQSKITAYTTYIQDFNASMKNVRTALKTCSDTTLTGVALLSACTTALGKVTDIPNDDLKQYITAIQTQYKAMLDITTQVTALTDPLGKQYTQYKALHDQVYTIEDKVSAAGRDFSSNITKHAQDADPSTAANALDDFLQKQSR